LGKEYRSLSSSLCNFLHSPVTSSLLGPNTLLSTLFSYTFSLRSSLNVSDQASHPYKTTGKIIVLYILIFKFLDTHKTLLKHYWQLSTLTVNLWDVKPCLLYIDAKVRKESAVYIFRIVNWRRNEGISTKSFPHLHKIHSVAAQEV
jgi:hypothetical protein